MRGVCEENHAGMKRASTCHRDCGAPEKSRSIRCAPSHGSVAQLRMTKVNEEQLTVILHAQFLHFLVVVLAVENVPFLGTFQDGALLVLDFLAGSGVNFGFLAKQFLQDAADFQADAVAVLDKLHFIHGGQRVSDGMGQLVDLVAVQSHSTALYLRTSSPFTFLNISW